MPGESTKGGMGAQDEVEAVALLTAYGAGAFRDLRNHSLPIYIKKNKEIGRRAVGLRLDSFIFFILRVYLGPEGLVRITRMLRDRRGTRRGGKAHFGFHLIFPHYSVISGGVVSRAESCSPESIPHEHHTLIPCAVQSRVPT